MGTATSVRDRILLAATQVVSEVGSGHLTLDRVAATAGVSKGGLLYHFGTKRELIQAMVFEVLGAFRKKITAKMEQTEVSKNVRLAATIQVVKERTTTEKQQLRALFAAYSEDPKLLEPAREVLKNHVDEIRNEAIDSDAALTIVLAIEGIRFMELFELLPLDQKEVDHMLDRLHGLCV
ncbi:MAG: TetR/AcrR family transcriptional regulator [Pseudomonadales bacterium]|nr:TetR/AcrR family transcriptional regulator [Pseudomonadales bacterium]